MNAVTTFALLSAIFVIKHLLADFCLQTEWMAVAKEARSGWLVPLTAHCAWHAGMTAAIVLAVAPSLWWLAVIDFFVHAAIDRGKGLAIMSWQVTPMKEKRWWLIFGTDQALHQLTHLGWALVLVSAYGP
ncbi:MAG TPA: DUF3307 domain-containing protein [Pseudolabrys sp.]|nr:DUF3307 domain-containing protein [Pseudolabrys sp.]